MCKLFKLVGISVVISLLALSLVACTAEYGMSLRMTVDTPQEGATVTTSPVTVAGTVNKTATVKTVKINDAVVPVKSSKFSTSVTLAAGTNVINIVATSVNPDETMTKTVTVTYAPAK